MTKNRYLLMFLSILLLVALACGPLGGNNGGNENTADTDNAPEATEAVANTDDNVANDTATDEVDDEPAATSEPAPTATAAPEPTATSEPQPADLIQQTNQESGLAYGIPEGWEAENLFTLELISSNAANMTALESDEFAFEQIDGAFGIILTGTPEETDVNVPPGSSALDALNAFIADPDFVSDVMVDFETVEGPADFDVNGQDAAQATLYGTDGSGSAGYLVIAVVASAPDNARYAVAAFLISEAQYDNLAADVDAIIQSFILGEPSGGTNGGAGGIGQIPEGYAVYTAPDGYYSLFYPGDWTTDDTTEEGLTYVVSDPALIDSDDFSGGAGVIILASSDVNDLFEFFTPAEVIDLFTADDSEIFDSIESVGDLSEYETFGQTVTSKTVSGTADGNPVQAIVAVIQNGDNAAIAIAVTDDPAELGTLQTIIDSILITGGAGGGDGGDGGVDVGEATPILVNQWVEGTWDNTSGDVDYVFPGIAGVPVLIVLVPDELGDATLELYDDSGSLEYVDENFSGEPEAFYFVPESSGDYVVRAGNFFGDGGDFTLYVLDLTPSSAAIVDIDNDSLVASGSVSYSLEVSAGVPIIIFVRPVGGNADDMDLTLLLSDSGGDTVADVDDGLSGEPEFIFYIPEANATFGVEVEEFFGEAGDFEIYLLELPAS